MVAIGRVDGINSRVAEYQEIVKTCMCDVTQWNGIQWAVGVPLDDGQATRINKTLKGPLAKKGDVVQQEPGEGNTITFSLVSKMKLKLEMICVTVADDSTAKWCYLGPASLIEKAIPPGTPEERCANVGAKLGMWIAKTELPLGIIGGGEVVLSPGPGHMLRAGERVWFRYSRRRFVTPILVVSQAAHDANVLRTPHLVFKELSQTEQYLMIPAISRQDGCMQETHVAMRSFVEHGDITEEMLQDTATFFMDRREPENKFVRLVAMDVFKRSLATLDRPAAIAGNHQLYQIKDGALPTARDSHGVLPQPELLAFLNLRSVIGNVAGMIHTETPKVKHGLPEPFGGRWFESPLGTLSIADEQTELLFLGSMQLASEVDHELKSQARQQPEQSLVKIAGSRPKVTIKL